jgi:hypothetical protein
LQRDADYCDLQRYIIQMFFEGHDPPHVHAIYSGAKALIRISAGEVIRGGLPRKQAKLVEAHGCNSGTPS